MESLHNPRRLIPKPFVENQNSMSRVSDRLTMESKEKWLSRQVGHYEAEYTNSGGMKALAVSYNVASKKPPPGVQRGSFNSWIPKEADTQIIFIALQEVDMSAAALLKEETDAQGYWMGAVCTSLGAEYPNECPIIMPSADASAVSGAGPPPPAYMPGESRSPFYLIAWRQLVGVFSMVFVKKELLPHVKEVAAAVVATGAMGTLGNKGGVGIRMQVHLTKFLFLDCHLAAGQTESSRRVQDFSSILSHMGFLNNSATGLIYGSPVSNTSLTSFGGDSADNGDTLYTLFDHDVVVVCGDLNFRVSLPYEEAVALSEQERFADLLAHDQLLHEYKTNAKETPFRHFTHLDPVGFHPTYRYDMGTSRYDTSEKKRIPAYTDRILYWAAQRYQNELKVNWFKSNRDVPHSDHKPIFASLTLPVSIVNKKEKEGVLGRLRKMLEESGLDRVAAAKVSLSETAIDFGRVSYATRGAKRAFTITNNGQSVAEVKVMRKGVTTPGEGSWICVSHNKFSILPGEAFALELECVVDGPSLSFMKQLPPPGCGSSFAAESGTTAAGQNASVVSRGRTASAATDSSVGGGSTIAPPPEMPQLTEDGSVHRSAFLVLAVENGPLNFVEVSADVVPSCFGNTLEHLVMLVKEPCVAGYHPNTMATSVDVGKAGQRPQIPKEAWYMVDFLFQEGHRCTPQLFMVPGEPDEVAAIVEHVDNVAAPLTTGKFEGNPFSPCAVAHALLLFLRDLQDPVVPSALYVSALQAGRAGGHFPMSLLAQFPPVHYNVFVYLTAFLRFLLRPPHNGRNQLSVAVLSQVFSSVLLRKPSLAPGHPLPAADRQHAAAFVAPFLEENPA